MRKGGRTMPADGRAGDRAQLQPCRRRDPVQGCRRGAASARRSVQRDRQGVHLRRGVRLELHPAGIVRGDGQATGILGTRRFQRHYLRLRANWHRQDVYDGGLEDGSREAGYHPALLRAYIQSHRPIREHAVPGEGQLPGDLSGGDTRSAAPGSEFAFRAEGETGCRGVRQGSVDRRL